MEKMKGKHRKLFPRNVGKLEWAEEKKNAGKIM